jgi:hypothetical protein
MEEEEEEEEEEEGKRQGSVLSETRRGLANDSVIIH